MSKLALFALGYDSVGSIGSIRGVQKYSKIVLSVEELKYMLFTVHPT
jgi:hypothetical protein